MSDTRSFLQHLLNRVDAAESASRSVLPATPPRGHQRMCVGMATFDDWEGVWFTIQAIRLYHPEIAGRLGFLIVDNHPESAAAQDLKALENWIPSLRYVPFRGYRGTSVRDLIFHEADADIICCVDSHVLIAPGALAAIERWFDAHPDSRDLIQGPLLSDGLDSSAGTHFEPTWGAGMYGQWSVDPRWEGENSEPFEIAMQGLGLFACRQAAWPGLNPRLRGFGSEEGYLHEKVRRGGGRVLCHPAVGWVHRFSRPHGPPYLPTLPDVVRNYLIGWGELGWDTAEVEEHVRDQYEAQLGREGTNQLIDQARAEAANPLSFFDGIFCLNLDRETDRWTKAKARFRRLRIDWQVERVPAVETPENHHRGHVISFRRMVAEARRRGYEHVLILEDDAVFMEDTLTVVATATAELETLEWDLCFLGACVWSQTFPFVDGSDVLQVCGPVSCTHAVAIHRRAYARILTDIPADDGAIGSWLEEWTATDQYLLQQIAAGVFRAVITSPRVASQPALLSYDDGDRGLAERYVI